VNTLLHVGTKTGKASPMRNGKNLILLRGTWKPAFSLLSSGRIGWNRHFM